MSIEIEFYKIHPGASTPVKAHDDDAGFDFRAVMVDKMDSDVILCYTGICVNIPPGWEGQLRPRSSIRETGLILCNSPGTIDAGFQGELIFSYRIVGRGPLYKEGDKCGQIIFKEVPKVTLKEVKPDSWTKSKRGTGGYGSTGK